MKSKAKHFGILTLLAMATSVGNVWAQTLPPIERPSVMPIQERTAATRSNANLPPIVNGSQNQLPPIVSGQNLPPIVPSNQQNSGGFIRPEPNSRGLRPMVTEQPAPQLPGQGRQPQSPIQEFGKQKSNSVTRNTIQPKSLKPVQLPQLFQNKQSHQESGTVEPNLLPQTLNQPREGQLLSASGVPYYSSNRRPENVRFTVEQPEWPTNNNVPPSNRRQESASSNDSGLIQQPTLQQRPADAEAVERARSVITPRDTQEAAQLPGEGNPQPRVAPQDEAAPMTAPVDWAGESNYFDMSQGQPEFTPGCQDCLNAGGAANCPTCNPSNSSGNWLANRQRLSRHGYFGAMSCARRYAELDLLYMTRTDGSIVFSNFGGLGSFDWSPGLRATLGQRDDETQGRELSYFGTQDLTKSVNRTDASSRLSALFSPVGVIDTTLTAPFFDANIQNETMQTRLHSLELNRVRWAWDVVKSYIGVRYIYVDDNYNMFSQQGVNTAEYDLQSLNNLMGVHIGREIFYDVGYRVSFSGLAKGGIYANGNRFKVNVSNNGTPFVANRTDSAAFSTSLELLLTGHYQINRRARLRMGYQALLLDNVYSVADNLPSTLSPFLGSRKPSKDSMFFHGLSVGFEFYR